MHMQGKKITFRKLADPTFTRITSLVFGEAKVGKTSLVRTVEPMLPKKDGKPDWGKVLFVIADPGTASISDLRDISTFTLFRDGDPMELLEYLRTGGDKEFQFIFIDGLDRASQMVWERAEAEEARKPKPDHWNVWRSVGATMRKWICGMRDLSSSVFFLTHVKEKDDSDVKYRPSFVGGSVADELLGYFDYVLYMRMVPSTDPVVQGRAHPAVFMTNRDMKKGGDPRYEVGNRMPPSFVQLPGKMPADLSIVWQTLFANQKKVSV